MMETHRHEVPPPLGKVKVVPVMEETPAAWTMFLEMTEGLGSRAPVRIKSCSMRAPQIQSSSTKTL